jgi:hypothetical protein
MKTETLEIQKITWWLIGYEDWSLEKRIKQYEKQKWNSKNEIFEEIEKAKRVGRGWKGEKRDVENSRRVCSASPLLLTAERKQKETEAVTTIRLGFIFDFDYTYIHEGSFLFFIFRANNIYNIYKYIINIFLTNFYRYLFLFFYWSTILLFIWVMEDHMIHIISTLLHFHPSHHEVHISMSEIMSSTFNMSSLTMSFFFGMISLARRWAPHSTRSFQPNIWHVQLNPTLYFTLVSLEHS